MELYQHAINWSKGEIFEGKLLLIFGLVTLIGGILFWKVGGTAASKAMLYPLVVTGFLFSVISVGLIYNNHKRIPQYSVAYHENQEVFASSEKARVENFISWYPVSRNILMVVALGAFALYYFWPAPLARAIAMTVLYIVVAGFFIDHFSEERGRTYYEAILAYV